MAKFWKIYIVATTSLFVVDWALGVGRFYFPFLKMLFLVFNFPFSILFIWLESKSSTWWFNILGSQVINDEIAQLILFLIMILFQSVLYALLFLLIKTIIKKKRTQAVKL